MHYDAILDGVVKQLRRFKDGINYHCITMLANLFCEKGFYRPKDRVLESKDVGRRDFRWIKFCQLQLCRVHLA